MDGINLAQYFDVLPEFSQDLLDLFDVLAAWCERYDEIIDVHERWHLTQIFDILIADDRKVDVLSADEPDLWPRLNGASNFDIKDDRVVLGFFDNAHHFAVVNVDDVVWLDVPLDDIVVAVQSLAVGEGLGIHTVECYHSIAFDLNRAFFCVYLRQSDFSASDFGHEPYCLMRPEPLSLLELVNELLVLFEWSMTEVEPSHHHASVKKTHGIFDLLRSRSKEKS